MSLLELRDVVKHYGNCDEPVRAVDGVSLRVAPGELKLLADRVLVLRDGRVVARDHAPAGARLAGARVALRLRHRLG